MQQDLGQNSPEVRWRKAMGACFNPVMAAAGMLRQGCWWEQLSSSACARRVSRNLIVVQLTCGASAAEYINLERFHGLRREGQLVVPEWASVA